MPESDVQAKEEAVKLRAPKLSAEKALPQSGADTLVRIIKGYAVASSGGQTKINYKDVASAAGLSPTIVSGNNKFLLDSQILFSPKYGYYVPTENAVRFARESAWDEASAKAHLRTILAASWYGQIILQNFALRPQLTRAEMKRALAIKSGATEGDSNALDFLIDFLIYTGLVVEGDKGALKKGEVDETKLPEPPATIARQAPVTEGAERDRSKVERGRRTTTLLVHLHIHDLDQLTPENAIRVKEWVRSIVNESSSEVEIEIGQKSRSAADDEDLALST
jgi:hypothetical protein